MCPENKDRKNKPIRNKRKLILPLLIGVVIAFFITGICLGIFSTEYAVVEGVLVNVEAIHSHGSGTVIDYLRLEFETDRTNGTVVYNVLLGYQEDLDLLANSKIILQLSRNKYFGGPWVVENIIRVL